MRKLLLLLIALLFYICGFSQNNILRGIVKLQSSGAKPLADVQISAFGAGTVYANSNGMFELVFNGKKPGASLSLLVQKDGYEVINDKELENCVLRTNPDDLVFVVMAKQGERNKQALAYYNIIVGNTNNNYKKELKDIHTKLEALDEDDSSRQTLRTQIASLQDEKEALLNKAEELAKQLANVDLDRASGLAQAAYQKFKEGDIKAALVVLDDKTLDNNLQEAQLEKAKLQSRLIKADSALFQSIENFMIKARFCVTDRQYDEAFKNYLKAIEADSSKADNLTEVGDYCDNLNQQKRAIRFYRLALENTNAVGSKINLLIKLGNQFSYDDNFKNAEDSYAKALKLADALESGSTANAEYLANTQIALGRMHLELNDQVKAEESYLKSLEIRKALALKDPKKYEPDVAGIRRAIGDMYSKQKDFPKAEEAFSQALEIYHRLNETHASDYKAELAATYGGMAVLQSRMEEFSNAEAAYLEAIDIYKELVEANPFQHEPNLATMEMNLSVMFYNAGNYPNSEAGYLKTIKIYKRLADENPQRYEPSLAKTQLNLGSLYSTLEDYKKSEESYLNSLKIRRRLAKENPQRFDVALCHVLLNIAYMKKRVLYSEYDMKQKDEAIAMLQEVERILKNYDANLPWVKAFTRDANRFKTYFVGITKEDLLVLTEIDKTETLEESNQSENDLSIVLSNQDTIITMLETAMETYPANKKLLARTAEAYGTLAEYQLFNQQFSEAEASATKGLSLDSAQAWINSYLALALTYQGKSKKAQKIISEMKDRIYEEEQLNTIFLEDLEALEKEGIIHKDNVKIRELLK